MAGFREGLVRERVREGGGGERGRGEGDGGRGRGRGEEGGKDVQETREGRTKARLSTIEQLVLDSKCRIVDKTLPPVLKSFCYTC